MGPQVEAAAGFRRLSRGEWASVAGVGGHALSEQAVQAALGANPSLDPGDVRSVLVPLARYLGMRADHARALRAAESEFLGTPFRSAPFVVGVVGPVAVGKSTLAATLEALLAGPDATVVSTDSFLYPNAVLEARGIVDRKGFPESYDWDALTAFLLAVRSGESDITTPVYSHDHYDVLDGAVERVGEPGVLVVEGLNLLQAPPTPGALEPADLVDLAIYVDADGDHIRQWFIERFLGLRAAAGDDPWAFFHMFAVMSDDQALDTAVALWEGINAPNIRDHIAPTRSRADLVLVKGEDHGVQEIHLRLP